MRSGTSPAGTSPTWNGNRGRGVATLLLLQLGRTGMKIFCIGLNKTGTSSLHQALQTLGFRSLHLGGPEVPVGIKRATDEGRGLVEYLGDYDAFSDIWRLSERFELLDRQYPGSKFILTIRDLDGWLESRRQHVQRNVLRKAQGHYSGGFLTVDIERWTHEFDEHHARVLDYFCW
jgi:hypothetical protein